MNSGDRIFRSARALFESGDHAAAAKTLDHFLREHKGSPEMYLLLSQSLIAVNFEAGREAADALEKGLTLYPNHEQLLLELGDVYFIHLLEHEKALSCFETVLAHNPNSVGAHLGIAALYPDGVSADRAIQHLLKVTELDPEVQDLYTRIATMYSYKRDYQSALYWYQEALKHNVANREGVEKRIREIRERLSQRGVSQ